MSEQSEITRLHSEIECLKHELLKEKKTSSALLTQVKKQLQKHSISSTFEFASSLQKKIAETSQQLLHQTDAFESLYQHSGDGVLFIENNKIVECNKSILDILGCTSKAQVLDLHPSALSPEYQPDGRSSIEKANELIELAYQKKHHRFEWMHRRINGECFWTDVVLTSMRLNEKALLHVSWRDISKLKALEAGIIKERDEARRANQIKSEFLSKMSHELRTPMNAILGFTQLLELDKDEFKLDHQDSIHEILNAGNHLLNLINEVLDLSRIESGKMNIILSSVDLSETIHSCLNLIAPQAKQKHVKLIDYISKHHYQVQADVTRLTQVILNLLSNAVKYNQDSGSVTLDAYLLNSPSGVPRLRITVQDTGLGLNASDMEKIFLPFERLGVDDNIEGTGIGLTIANNIVKLMSGRMGVESSLGVGSTFWLELNRGSVPIPSNMLSTT